jgi:hypothetical protein
LTEIEEKILDMLKVIDGKLDKILKNGAKVAEAPVKPATPTPTISDVPKPTTVKPSAVLEKQEEAEKAKEKPPVEGRRVCSCGSTEFNAIEDKTKILHQQGGMKIYAKKYICKRCGKEM